MFYFLNYANQVYNFLSNKTSVKIAVINLETLFSVAKKCEESNTAGVKNSIRWSATRVLCAVIWECMVVYLEIITTGGGLLLLTEAINFLPFSI